MPAFSKHARYLVCTVLGAAEHEHLLHLGVRQQKFLEERSLAALVDAVKFLTDAFNRSALRSNFHTHRIRAQNRRGKFRDIVGHGRAEEQVLPILRKERHHLADIVNEAHIEHAVGLVEHEEFQRLQRNRLLVDEVQETARSRHQHVDTANQIALLADIAHATENASRRNGRKLRILLKAILHLDREFTRRQKNQRTASFRSTELARIQQQLQNGEREGSRLSRTRLGNAKQVLALEQTRDGLFLDGVGCS